MAEWGSGALSGEAQAKMERLESRTRATATTLASVALPADQVAWRDKIMALEVELNGHTAYLSFQQFPYKYG